MRLTTKGRFAVTAMIDLGLRQASGPVTLAAISQRQQISLSYLEQLFGKLRRNELVESTRGPGGGYTLAFTLGDALPTDWRGASGFWIASTAGLTIAAFALTGLLAWVLARQPRLAQQVHPAPSGQSGGAGVNRPGLPSAG